LREQLKEHRTEVLRILRQREAQQSKTYLLSWNQFGMWFTHEASPSAPRITSRLPCGSFLRLKYVPYSLQYKPSPTGTSRSEDVASL
jgi:hypothetical protein